jgi:hypothetical protein
MVWIRDQGGVEIGTAHHYVYQGTPISPLDPKTFTIGGIRYTIDPNPEKANPEHRLPFRWMKKTYGWIRRNIICPAFGPLDRLP